MDIPKLKYLWNATFNKKIHREIKISDLKYPTKQNRKVKISVQSPLQKKIYVDRLKYL